MNQINLDRRIVCAANKYKDILLVGARHWDITMRAQYDQIEESYQLPCHSKFEQGFINTWGEFLTRKEAWVVAQHHGQVFRYVGNQDESDMHRTDVELFSENLY